MTSQDQPSADDLRDTLIAELRCGSMRARLAQYDLDALGIALKHGLISAEQAMELLHARDALPWIFQERAAA